LAIPLVLYAASGAQLAPAAAAFAIRGRQQPVPYPRVVIWCIFLVFTDVVDRVVTRTMGNNLWTAYLILPVEVRLVLWILSAWQVTPFLQLAYTIVIPVMGLMTASLLLLTDPSVTFYRWVAPFLALLALVLSLHTLVYRALLSRKPLQEQDWFWFCLGLSLFWIGYVSLPVFADMFVVTHEEWVRWAYILRAWSNIVAFLVMSWGILRHRGPEWSGSSSARA
jgi:hypothetical protein